MKKEHISNKRIIALLLLPLAIGCAISCIAYIIGKIEPVSVMKNDWLYIRAINTINNWLFSEFMFMAVYIVLSIMPFLCTASILYLEFYYENVKETIILISILSLTFMSFSYFLKPNIQAQMYRKAYEVLKPAIINYESQSEKTQEVKEMLMEEIDKGENFIGTGV